MYFVGWWKVTVRHQATGRKFEMSICSDSWEEIEEIVERRKFDRGERAQIPKPFRRGKLEMLNAIEE